MPATTTNLIETALVALIKGITPRHVVNRATAPWRDYEGDRAPSTVGRFFNLDWTTIGHTENGFIGPAWVDTSVTLTITVDYGGFPAHVQKHVAEDDVYQLRDILNRAKSTVDGLRWLAFESWDYTPASTDRNQAQARIQFLVRYMKARA